MIELLAIFGIGAAAYCGFKVGVYVQRTQVFDHLQRVGLMDQYVDSLTARVTEHDSNTITLTLERYENGVVYAHCRDTGVFLGQGTTIQELEAHIAKSINSPDFRLPAAGSLEELIRENTPQAN